MNELFGKWADAPTLGAPRKRGLGFVEGSPAPKDFFKSNRKVSSYSVKMLLDRKTSLGLSEGTRKCSSEGHKRNREIGKRRLPKVSVFMQAAKVCWMAVHRVR